MRYKIDESELISLNAKHNKMEIFYWILKKLQSRYVDQIRVRRETQPLRKKLKSADNNASTKLKNRFFRLTILTKIIRSVAIKNK